LLKASSSSSSSSGGGTSAEGALGDGGVKSTAGPYALERRPEIRDDPAGAFYDVWQSAYRNALIDPGSEYGSDAPWPFLEAFRRCRWQCCGCDQVLRPSQNTKDPGSIWINRINPTRGYIAGNVRPICPLCSAKYNLFAYDIDALRADNAATGDAYALGLSPFHPDREFHAASVRNEDDALRSAGFMPRPTSRFLRARLSGMKSHNIKVRGRMPANVFVNTESALRQLHAVFKGRLLVMDGESTGDPSVGSPDKRQAGWAPYLLPLADSRYAQDDGATALQDQLAATSWAENKARSDRDFDASARWQLYGGLRVGGKECDQSMDSRWAEYLIEQERHRSMWQKADDAGALEKQVLFLEERFAPQQNLTIEIDPCTMTRAKRNAIGRSSLGPATRAIGQSCATAEIPAIYALPWATRTRATTESTRSTTEPFVSETTARPTPAPDSSTVKPVVSVPQRRRRWRPETMPPDLEPSDAEVRAMSGTLQKLREMVAAWSRIRQYEARSMAPSRADPASAASTT
jgi:hypothetical protein